MEAKDAAAGFAVLAQETRLRLIRALASRGASGMAAGDAAAHLRVAPSTLSFHLAALEQSGLIRSTRQGRHIIYAVRFAGLRELLSFLNETCCAGRPELCGDLARLLPDEIEEETIMEPTFNVLFICTRNSARSILAEAILQKVGKGKINAYSAGSDPATEPMPEVLDRLTALGHDVSQLHSKSWKDSPGRTRPAWISYSRFVIPARKRGLPGYGRTINHRDLALSARQSSRSQRSNASRCSTSSME